MIATEAHEQKRLLKELSKYDTLSKVPTDVLQCVHDFLQDSQGLVVGVLRGPNGWNARYFVEDYNTALLNHDAHKKDYRSNNPAIMHVYSRGEIGEMLAQ